MKHLVMEFGLKHRLTDRTLQGIPILSHPSLDTPS